MGFNLEANGGILVKFNHTGVWIEQSVNNPIRGNQVFDNENLGIDLLYSEGVTPNDPGDGDDGGNNRQNYPVLSSIAVNATETTVEGDLNSVANATFWLDFYASATCDSSGHGEGQVYLGAEQVTTDGSGDVSFSVTLPAAVTDGWAVSATATDPDGNTSEFSACTITGQMLSRAIRRPRRNTTYLDL